MTTPTTDSEQPHAPDPGPRVFVNGDRVVVEVIVVDAHDSQNILCALGAEMVRPSANDLRACEVRR